MERRDDNPINPESLVKKVADYLQDPEIAIYFGDAILDGARQLRDKDVISQEHYSYVKVAYREALQRVLPADEVKRREQMVMLRGLS